jgi:phosphoribosylanthranilate isomerase
MFVKMCGITNRDDALAAIDAGAHAIGLVFHKPSPRYADPAAVAGWIGEIPPGIWKVGVFVDEQPEVIEQMAANLRLDVAQLHGSETPDRHPRGIRIWKAFRVENGTVPDEGYPAEAILLDGPGKGQTFDWRLTRRVPGKIIVAGGLTPENVRAAIEQTNPIGVDAASGVEISPGRKDHARMKQFIQVALGL